MPTEVENFVAPTREDQQPEAFKLRHRIVAELDQAREAAAYHQAQLNDREAVIEALNASLVVLDNIDNATLLPNAPPTLSDKVAAELRSS